MRAAMVVHSSLVSLLLPSQAESAESEKREMNVESPTTVTPSRKSMGAVHHLRLVGVDGVGEQLVEGEDLERADVGGGEDDGRGDAHGQGLFPAAGAQAPAIAGL